MLFLVDSLAYKIQTLVNHPEETYNNIKIDNSSFERMEEFKIFGNNLNKSKFYSGNTSEVRECSFGVETFVFQFAIEKYRD
jgi:hypothetical protein